jgi:hypothetical protein
LSPDPKSPRCECGHAAAEHYNASAKAKRAPCHHLGKHDTRCSCADYRAVRTESVVERMAALEAKRSFSLGATILSQMEQNLGRHWKDPGALFAEKGKRAEKVPASRLISGATERPQLGQDGSISAKKKPG